MRRKWLGACTLILLLWFAAGNTFLATWLSASIFRFALFWLGLVMWLLLVIVFALYDALMAVREERERMK